MQKADRFVLLLLAISLVANLGMFRLWHRDRAELRATMQGGATALYLPKAGATIDSLQLANNAGQPLKTSLGASALPIVVYVLSPNCNWCKLNRTSVNSLAGHLQGKYLFIGVSTVPKEDWSHDMQSDYAFPIYFVSRAASHPTIPLSITPQTLVFAANGQFDKGWSGAYTGGTELQVGSFFGVDLAN